MTNANQPRAVLVAIPENEQKALADFLNDYGEDYKDNETQEWASKIYEAKAIDVDALRLVLEAAKWAQDTKDDGRNGGEDFVVWENTQDAIAKLSSLI